MGRTAVLETSSVSDRAVRVAWLLLPVALVGFFVLRVTPGAPALAAAQVVFLLPVAGAAAACEWAHRIGPRGSERSLWGIVAIALLFLFAGEGYYSWYQIAVSPAGPPAPSLYDAVNLLAALTIVVALGVAAGLSRLTWGARVRLVLDAIATLVVAFLFIYHYVVLPISPRGSWHTGALWALYSLVGVAILLGVLWYRFGFRTGGEKSSENLASIALAVFSLGVIATPVWRLSVSTSGTSAVDALSSTVVLGGYYLLMVAALVRIRDRNLEWQSVADRLSDVDPPSRFTVVAVLVLVSVFLAARWTYLDLDVLGDDVLDVTLAVVATLAAVARLVRPAANIHCLLSGVHYSA